MRKYEAIFILNDRKFDDGGKAYAGKVEEILKACGASDVSHETMGRKQFARPIGKRTSGTYWSFIFNMEPARVAEFQDKFTLEEAVLRVVVFNYEKPEQPKTLQLENR